VIGVVHRGRPIRYILKPYISVTNKFTASLTEHTHTHALLFFLNLAATFTRRVLGDVLRPRGQEAVN